MTINKMYSAITKTSIITGICAGGYYGIKEAKRNYCSRKDLTIIEKFGEYFCFGYVCFGFSLSGGLLGWIYGVTSPLTIPTTIYLMIKNNNHHNNNHHHKNKTQKQSTIEQINLYTRNFPTQQEGHNKIETHVLLTKNIDSKIYNKNDHIDDNNQQASQNTSNYNER